MKESNTHVGNAIIKQLQRQVLLHTKGQYMKESNTLAGNAIIKELQRQVLLNTKEQYMKESNTLAVNVENISVANHIWVNTKWKVTKNQMLHKYEGEDEIFNPNEARDDNQPSTPILLKWI